MTIPEFWSPDWTAPLVNHLWQSTALVLVAWLLTLALRTNAARVRYWVWMFASVKFLVPFALLASMGTQWARPVAGLHAGSAFYITVQEFSQPFQQSHAPEVNQTASASPSSLIRFAPEMLAAIWMCGSFAVLLGWNLGLKRAARTVMNSLPVEDGREYSALRREERTLKIREPIPLLLSSRAMEPGIFGVFRPVLLWPAGLSEQLDDAQIQAIVAHEVEHVRRRDNLTSALHTLVEALFWFHPAVRWIGSKMNEERESACDEKVLEQSSRPDVYAESILKVCEFCLEPTLPCVSGVSGSDLKERILRIMMHRSGVALNFRRKAVLSVAALLVFAAPIGFGVLHGQTGSLSNPDSSKSSDVSPDLPKFEVATIKPATANEGRSGMMITPDGTSMHGITAQMLLRQAFDAEDDRILGAPAWVKSNRFDIEAKVAPEDAPKLDKLKAEKRRSMLLPLLSERFNLKYHHETRELSMYALVIAKGGPKLAESKPEDSVRPDNAENPDAKTGGPPKDPIGKRGLLMMSPGRLEAHGTGMAFLAHALAPQIGRTVLDKTGLSGSYDYTLQWTPDDAPPPRFAPEGGPPRNESGSDAAGPSLLTALQEQLGLKLESEKGTVDVIVIDHIDLPSAN